MMDAADSKVLAPRTARSPSEPKSDHAARRADDIPPLESVLAQAQGFGPTQVGARFRIDQEARWKRGERVLVERYIQGGSLHDAHEEILDLIFQEYLLRQALGDAPEREEYLQRFPQYAEQIHNQLNASAIIERLFPEDSREHSQRKPRLSHPSLTNVNLGDGTLPGPISKSRSRHRLSQTDLQLPERSEVDLGEPAPLSFPTLNLDELFPEELPSPSSEHEPGMATLVQDIDQLFPDVLPPQSPSLTAVGEAALPKSWSSKPSSGTVPSEGSSKTGSAWEMRLPSRLPLPNVENFEILEELGRGGMGVVYKARDLRLKRVVALKMILAGVHAGPRERARFRAEAEAVARLHHPNIVQIYEISEQAGRPYLTLEFVDGRSLASRLTGTPFPTRDAGILIAILARAIHAAHKDGIVHRDLKPGNVLLTLDGQPKITDFGLAKRLDDETDLSRSGAIVGTPSYMAPEQAWGKSKGVTPATDTYALGAILYELLTGRPPFKAATAMETIEQICTQDPVPPRQLQPRLPRDIETICLKCLQKEPGKRYPSAEALAADLGRFVRGEPILARPTARWELALRWARRRPAAAALIGMSLAALLGVFALTVWHNADLQVRLEEARQAEQQATRDRQLVTSREEVHQLINAGQAAFQERKYREAQLCFTGALARIGAEEQLQLLRLQVDEWLARTQPFLLDQEARQQARARLEKFQRCYHDALFHSTLIGGPDLGSNRAAARAAAEEGLRLFDVRLETDTALVVRADLFSAAERTEILAGCYDLLQVLADIAAVPATDGAVRQALRLLDRAARLGLHDTRAFHLRRARYFELLGDQGGARKETAAGEALLPATAFEYFLLGEELFRRGDLERASHAFDQALHKQTNHFPAQYLVALCYLKMHRLTEGKVSLNACLNLRPDFLWLYLLRGYAQSELDDFESAAKDFQAVLERQPSDEVRYGVFLHQGTMHLRQQKYAEAEADFRQALALRPALFLAYVNLAQVFRKQGKLDEAVVQFQHAIQCAPEQAALYRQRARLYLARNDDLAALTDFRQALERESREPSSAALRAADYLECGRILLRCRRFQEAVTACDAGLALSPTVVEAHRVRAEALVRQKRYPEAISSFDLYLKHGKPDAEVYLARGSAKARMGNHQAAIIDYSHAVELKPNTYSFAVRGWAFVANDQVRLALPDFDEAVRLEAQNGFAHNGRAYVLARLGRHREAVTDAEAALRFGPETSGMLLTSARVFALAGGHIDADTHRSGREALETRAQLHQRAVQLLRKAVEAQPVRERAAFWDRFVRPEPDLKAVRGSVAYAELDRQHLAPRK